MRCVRPKEWGPKWCLGRRGREISDGVAPPERSADGGETGFVCAP